MGALAAPPPHLCVRKVTGKAKGAMHPQPKGWHWHFSGGLQVSKEGQTDLNKQRARSYENMKVSKKIKDSNDGRSINTLKEKQHHHILEPQQNPEDPWINESINREQDSQQIPLHPALSHLRKLRSTICQVADALRSLSRWLLSKGSPLLQRAILGEKLTLSWGHYVIPFWVQMKKR